MKIYEDQYLADCNDFIVPLDEIAEAIINNEGVSGISNHELLSMIEGNKELKCRLTAYL